VHQTLVLELQESGQDALPTLALAGELDVATAPRLEATIKRVCEEGVPALMPDLRGLRFIDSAGLRALLAVTVVCDEHRCRLVLTHGGAEVERLFELAGAAGRLRSSLEASALESPFGQPTSPARFVRTSVRLLRTAPLAGKSRGRARHSPRRARLGDPALSW
jgi:anti-sigma B factor antagonist